MRWIQVRGGNILTGIRHLDCIVLMNLGSGISLMVGGKSFPSCVPGTKGSQVCENTDPLTLQVSQEGLCPFSSGHKQPSLMSRLLMSRVPYKCYTFLYVLLKEEWNNFNNFLITMLYGYHKP